VAVKTARRGFALGSAAERIQARSSSVAAVATLEQKMKYNMRTQPLPMHSPGERGRTSSMPALALALILAAPATPVPFKWTTLAGWRTETIPFPLDFAPSLKHRGLEELRFSPGMFKPDAPDFWSYAFVWWLEEEPAPVASTLERELPIYFRGLSEAVAKDKYKFDAARFKARFRQEAESIVGQIDSYDAFKTGKPITLNARFKALQCGKNTALVVALSPADLKAAIWSELNALTAKVACP
jgi:hypothetical protein